MTTRTDTTFALTWDSVFGADSYQVRYRPTGTSTWQVLSSDTIGVSIAGLSSCTTYEVAAKVICGGIDQGFGPLVADSTLGCGACLDEEYCVSRATDISFEWIERVQVSGLDNTSGPNGGLGDFTGQVYSLVAGQTLSVTLTPGYADAAFQEAWRIG